MINVCILKFTAFSIQSTQSKMVVGIVAGLCTVLALFLVFGGVYLYCCTSCCASKSIKVQPVHVGDHKEPPPQEINNRLSSPSRSELSDSFQMNQHAQNSEDPD